MKIGDKVKVNNDYKEFDENGKYTFSHCCGEIGIVKNIKNETRGEMVYIELENDTYGKTNFKLPITVLNVL